MTQELQAREKMEVESPAEQTKTGPVFVPAVDIYETEDGLTITADMPGVKMENITIDLTDNVLTIKGGGEPESGNKRFLHREYQTGSYFRQFTLSEVIDQDGIVARLKDGVLILELPKVAKAKPRQIEVKVG